MCTHVAKRLLNGEEITVVNAEKARISGDKAQVLAHYKQRRARGKNERGPYYPRTPDMILRRSVRGMVNYKSPNGRAAYKRLRVFVGVPNELKDKDVEVVEGARKVGMDKYVYLGDITKELGSRRV